MMQAAFGSFGQIPETDVTETQIKAWMAAARVAVEHHIQGNLVAPSPPTLPVSLRNWEVEFFTKKQTDDLANGKVGDWFVVGWIGDNYPLFVCARRRGT